ncbi:hypothetical protein [Candidatus Tisiphia endosymbiont of Myopa tessellatipennis]|uniref:hypothetical protein n=1 Tax=Candidatus Tisiphia endosymbiont of Myopa tessellatipennis TaxID=3066257 RepID=UPI00313EAE99
MAKNQEELKQSLHTQLFTTLITLAKSKGEDSDINTRISKKCEELASSVIALAQKPSESNIDLYRKKMRKLTHSKYIVGEALKVIKETFPGDQNQSLRELIDIPLMDALAKENKPVLAKKLEKSRRIPLETMLRDRTKAQQGDFLPKGHKQAGVSAGYVAEEKETQNIFMLKSFYKQHDNCFNLQTNEQQKQALADRNDGVRELIGSSMYQFLLYDRTPKEALVVYDQVKSPFIAIRSKFFDNVVQQLSF